MDLKRLAETVTVVLAPALPHLLSGGTEERQAPQGNVEEADSILAKGLWERLRARIEAEPLAHGAAKEVAEEPEEDDARAALRRQLRKILDADEELAAELTALLGPAVSARPVGPAALVHGSGMIAQGPGAVAAGQVAVGQVQGDFIVAVDALQFLERLGQRRPAADLAAATGRYLEYLVDYYRCLDLRGMGVSDKVPLRLPLLGMYVALKARQEAPAGETWDRRFRVAGREASAAELESLGERLGAPVPILDLLQKHAGLILLGDPGAGKTTFLKYLALMLASGEGEALGLGTRLPVLLPLAAYANALAEKNEPLLDFIVRYYEKERGVGLPFAALLERGLAEGKVLFLLDGLDEVRERHRRHLVVERVRELYSLYRWQGNKLVVTSRIVGYREVRPEAEGLAECMLADFDEEEIEEFIGRWTAALEKAASGESKVSARAAERERESLLASVHGNPGVRSLASNPLLLTILALMKRQGVELPQRRIELYKTYVDTLLKHWNLARNLEGRAGRDLDLVETMKLLAPLALWMHERSPGIGLVKEGDLHRQLEELYAERGYSGEVAAQFLEDVRAHSALLLDRGGRQYGFIHLTFQEYLAAVALAQKAQQGAGAVVDVLAAHAGDATWHEVSLLTVGYLAIVQQWEAVASEVVEELLRRSPGLPGEASVLAGRAVADAGAGGVTERCRGVVVASLLETMRATGRVPARVRAAAGEALALIGDPRPEVTKVDAMELRVVPAGAFWMGSGKEDRKAYPDESPRHEVNLNYEYRIGRYPVTVAQYREYVEASGAEVGDPECLRGPSNSPVILVSWTEAMEFSRWLTERWRAVGRLSVGWCVRLPSEAEWEKAARGADGRVYPWGGEFDPERCNSGEGGIGGVSTVGCFPLGVSPFGCEEMSGNVWEWTLSAWGDYPYDPSDGREKVKESAQIFRVWRGGSYVGNSRNARCAYRYWIGPDLRDSNLGFRVCVVPILL